MISQEIIGVVEKNNGDLREASDLRSLEWSPFLTFITDGMETAISFGGWPLRDSVDNECPYVNLDRTHREPLETCLRRRLREKVAEVSSVVGIACGLKTDMHEPADISGKHADIPRAEFIGGYEEA